MDPYTRLFSPAARDIIPPSALDDFQRTIPKTISKRRIEK